MSKRTVSGITLTLLLIGMLTLAFNIQPVKATGTVYIRADGSIDPPTANITSADNVTYYFTDNNYDEIVVERSNIIIDSAGYTLQGTGAYPSKGIDLTGRSNVTIRNMEIEAFYYGIYLSESSGNTISGNNITANKWDGIELWDSSNNTVSGNNITNNEREGIYLNRSPNNYILGNNITANGDRGIYFLMYSSNSSIIGNDISNNFRGIDLQRSSNNIVSGNTVTNNYISGVSLYQVSSNNTIIENNITNNKGQGISLLDGSRNNNVYGNNITNNGYVGNYSGIYLYFSFNNTISGNIIMANHWAGVELRHSSSDNRFYHNNFIDNAQQVRSDGYANFWDYGYPSGGNFWSDYAGVDVKSGPNQDQPSSDGIGDTPYVINGTNQDRYPLMHPWSPLTVHNINTGSGYATIQEALDALDTLDGHIIFVEAGTYWEHVVVNKSISLIGENKENTIIDGSRNGTVISVTADYVSISGLTIQNGYHIPHITYGIKVGEWEDGCNNVTVHDNIISDNDMGIFVYYSSNSIVFDNLVFNNYRGIDIVLSNDNYIEGNSLFNNEVGVVIGSDANSNMIHNNEIYNNGFCGISVGWSTHNKIVGNMLSCNSEAGIRLDASNNNNIIGNHIASNRRDGIVLFGSNSNTVTGNGLIQNEWDGIALWYSNSNSIYHNNFLDNTKQAGSYSGSINSWDYGYPLGGNYWSDHVCTGNPSDGSQPYIIDAYNVDHYPFQDPNGWLLHRLTVNSSPMTGITFTLNETPQSTPFTEWLLEGSYTLEMPETHNGYVWSHWLEDGDPNRTKTITLPGTTWTGVFVFAVQPCGPEAEFTAMPDTVLAGESIKFDASASLSGWNGTHEMPITEYRWDFGDGNQTTTSNPIVYHSFSSSGIYYVTLTVYAPGATPETDSTTKKVTITAIPVGGYSFPIKGYTTTKPLTLYLAIVAILAVGFTMIKRKTRRRTKLHQEETTISI